ncbi:hypothetical protein MYAER_2775 [Microcystis aeruginosa NIES-2549]|uniref:Uncharacterized protein n=1 Tax=Microcystis aeruginosa NIES-2549 TaxID=1641812 RepID=A0A0F6RLY2_MICAE|nr:hypothetical protein MYAER_2775 [Microcystis aeruginosa NIES-2549]
MPRKRFINLNLSAPGESELVSLNQGQNLLSYGETKII